MSFYHLPHPWNPGYAIPEYVMAEPPDRGTFTTKWLPRGTIPGLVPDYLAKPGKQLLGRNDADLGSLGESSLRCNSLSGDTLGAEEYSLEPLGGVDPVTSYGEEAALWIMSEIAKVPASQRKEALQSLLNVVDPSLWATIDRKGSEFRAKGMPPKSALAAAISVSLSEGFMKELIEAGARAQRGDRNPFKKQSLAGLGMYEDLGGWLSSTVGAVGGFVSGGVRKLGSLARKAACSSTIQVLAATAGGPAGAAGAAAAASKCGGGGGNSGGGGGGASAPAAPRTPDWLLPVAAVGGGVLLLLVLRKK